jgi:UDP-GlcNAc3NAcA epimerase
MLYRCKFGLQSEIYPYQKIGMQNKILTIIGARPQFIKAAAVSRALKSTGINEIIVHTGQHFDDNMSRVFFDELQIPTPAYNLDIHSLNHGAMTGRMLEKTEELILAENPSAVMVYGDTNSTLAGALAASKLHIPVAHVEAGLRSFNMKMPEEINRILTDRMSSILFCPTQTAVDNLMNEGFNGFGSTILLTGDVMYDAALFYASLAREPSVAVRETFILATIHRAENTDDPAKLKNILSSMQEIAAETDIVIPVHPRTRNIIKKGGLEYLTAGLTLIEPVGYLEMIWLLKNCTMVITDSGGLQKEACFFGKACITLREQTEWTELVSAGINRLAGTDPELILQAWEHFTKREIRFPEGMYGKGNASEMIAQALLSYI